MQQPLATPLGLVVVERRFDGLGELWHSTRTATGWVDERIATDISTASAAMAIDANDELIVAASYPSLAVAQDCTVHVAFEVGRFDHVERRFSRAALSRHVREIGTALNRLSAAARARA